jgi:hypothetical protein
MTERDVAPPPAARSVHWGEEREEDLPGGDLGEELVALARDPHALFVFWSYPPSRIQKTRSRLRSPRSVFRLYQGASLLKEVPFEVTSKSHYLAHLHGGKTYRVEPLWVDADGKTAPIGKPSNEVTLPPSAPAPEEPSLLRFVDVPVHQPVQEFRQRLEQRAVPVYTHEQEEPPSYLDWQVGALPGSAERAGRERQRRVSRFEGRDRPHYLNPSGAEAGPPGSSEHSR